MTDADKHKCLCRPAPVRWTVKQLMQEFWRQPSTRIAIRKRRVRIDLEARDLVIAKYWTGK